MGLTQKILLFTSLLVIALVATTLIFTTSQADQLAHRTIKDALNDTRDVWETFQADRYNKLKLGVRVLANDASFKALVQLKDPASVSDSLQERGRDLSADFFIATDPGGVVIARSDRPGGGEDLSKDPVVMKPLEGEESTTVWRQGDKLFQAVSVPMRFGNELVGVLIAGYAINEGLATQIRKITHSEIAYLTVTPQRPAALSVTSLEGSQQESLRAALGRLGPTLQTEPFELDLAGERHVAVEVPLKAATGETVGAVMALRSLAQETASFRRFRTSLIVVSLVVMAFALVIAFVVARRITGPVRRLVSLVERARDGSYSGAVSVQTSDEIGVLARSFNSLLADLREKEQMIGFLRDGLTSVKRKASDSQIALATTVTSSLTPTLSTALEKGSFFAARYEILGTVGRGGMGVVYRAQDRKLDEVVALKVLRGDVLVGDPTLIERFKQEIRLARKITHRNILRTHDFSEAEGIPFISMEYLEGVTLKELIVSKGALPVGVGLTIAKQMCQGLEAAHRQGVIHRDIKPQNMLILPETGELKIMDFGIARVSEMKIGDGGLTTDGTVMGTPDYIPPEQAQGRPADFRSDIYSLGVVLFEVFTGKLPFSGDSVMAIVLKQIQTPPPRPRSLNPRIPEDLEALILKCLEKDPARRYGQVPEILKDLTVISSRVDATAA
jgi:HAMP domain-containing protein